MPKRQAAAHAQPPRPVVPPPPRPEPAASSSAAPPAEPTDAVANRKHTDMRAILPPQTAPFDAAFVDAACAHYEMPDLDPKRLATGIDWDDVDLETELPCAGLGFDLRGLDWEPVEGGRDWARPFTRRPLVDIGLRFDGVTEHGLAGFATLLDFYKPGGRGVPQPNGSRRVAGYAMPRPEHAWLLATLPALLPPGSDEPWVRAYDLREVLLRLTERGTDPRGLVKPEVLRAWLQQPRPAPRPYRRPRPSGGVTRAQVIDSLGVMDNLVEAMDTLLGWNRRNGHTAAPAKVANAVASRLLGIRVDLRVGRLMDPEMIDIVVRPAAHLRTVDGEPLERRLSRHLNDNLPRVRVPLQSAGFNPLDGAAWSCDVARLVSAPEVWGIER